MELWLAKSTTSNSMSLLPVSEEIAFRAVSPLARSRQARTTRNPPRASPRAISNPIPALAPVTRHSGRSLLEVFGLAGNYLIPVERPRCYEPPARDSSRPAGKRQGIRFPRVSWGGRVANLPNGLATPDSISVVRCLTATKLSSIQIESLSLALVCFDRSRRSRQRRLDQERRDCPLEAPS